MPPQVRRKRQLYNYVSPPKVFPLNGNVSPRNKESNAIVIKPANIRIWIHEKDVGKLTQVLWAGQGARLRTETSSHPKVKRFLEYVPHIMGLIKDVHSSVIDNDIEYLRAKTAPPVPPQILSSKDLNGLTPLHKAAGLAHTKIVEYLLSVWPNAASERDATGKTPLHYAASAKNNSRVFNLLVQAGSDETALDDKSKTAAYYKSKPNDLDRSQLTVVPEAPRIAQQGFPPNFDWSFITDIDAKTFNLPTKSQSEYALNSTVENVPPRKLSLDAPSTTEADENGNEEEENNESADLDEVPSSNEDDLNNNEDAENGDDEDDENNDVETVAAESEENEPEVAENYTKLNGHLPNMNNNDSNEDEEQNENLEENNENLDENGNEESNEDNQEENEGEDNEQDVEEPEDPHIEPEEFETVEDGEEETEPDAENIEDEPPPDENEIESENIEAATEETNEEPEASNEIENEEEAPDNEEAPEAENEEEETPDNEEEAPEAENEEEANLENENEEVTQVENEEENPENEEESPEAENEEESPENENEEVAEVENEDENPENEEEAPEAENEEETPENEEESPEPENEEESPEPEPIESPENESEETNLEDSLEPINPDDDVPNDDDQTETIIENGPDPDEETIQDRNESSMSNELNAEILDVENNVDSEDQSEDNDIDENDVESPSSARDVEGYVIEEPEKQLESMGDLQTDDNESDDSIQDIVQSGNMEQLASLVLNGDGKRLIGLSSSQPDIQAFLDNVPAYMNKIRRVHVASREGSLRDLQSALDRRKFATAKDEISPRGATPLHVAVIFGHTGIIRYLGGRFPETASATDNENRTPLHYAATIKDNGHFYNLLMHLGANPKAEDNLGHTPEFYTNHEESDSILSHKELLRDFGAEEELADEMLNDQVEFKGNPVEIPLFRTEEGRYLATSLGDPLIKGLTEVANLRPSDPIAFLASYLQNFTKGGEPTGRSTTATIDNKPSKAVPPIQKQPEDPLPVMQNSDSLDDGPPSPDIPDSASSSEDRDEHGQSMLHFSAARSHGRNALFQLIEESDVSISYRDELYRTCRDVALQASQPENAKEIDRYVLSLAARGDYEAFNSLLLDGYDHLVDVTDTEGVGIVHITRARGFSELANYMETFRDFELRREKLLHTIRINNIDEFKEILAGSDDASKLARAKNYYGRTSLHVAVLMESEEMVEFLATNFRQTLRIGDNLERTPLHYAMGINNVESISRILIKNGAKRVVKDLKGRQPSYYFMNKSDILRLQEEEKD